MIFEEALAMQPAWFCYRVIWQLIAGMVISLAFDYADVVRYVLGETGPMTG